MPLNENQTKVSSSEIKCNFSTTFHAQSNPNEVTSTQMQNESTKSNFFCNFNINK
jgi:hypothetical protein